MDDYRDIKSSYRKMIEDPDTAGSSTWLISFTDVIALMLTFFVLMFAMSETEEKSWSEIVSTFQANFAHNFGPKDDRGWEDGLKINRIDRDKALDINYLHSIFQNNIEAYPVLKDSVSILQKEDEIVLLLTKSAVLTPTGRLVDGRDDLFKALASMLDLIDNMVAIRLSPLTGTALDYKKALNESSEVSKGLTENGYDASVGVISGYSPFLSKSQQQEAVEILVLMQRR